MAKVYISFGTNLGDKELNLHQAILLIQERCGKVEQKSSIYSSAPWGFQSFNNFLNQVVILETSLPPLNLMIELLQIENEMGRVRTSPSYQDRIIDIDILFYDAQIINLPELRIPHPKLHERNFILQPLLELNDLLVHPVLKKSISEIANSLNDPVKAFRK